MQSVQDEMAQMRASRGLTLREAAQKCDLHFGTVSKAENSSVRWETIHTILVLAYGARPGSKAYERIKESWLMGRLDRRPSTNPAVSTVIAASAEMDEKQLAKLHSGIEKLAARILKG